MCVVVGVLRNRTQLWLLLRKLGIVVVAYTVTDELVAGLVLLVSACVVADVLCKSHPITVANGWHALASAQLISTFVLVRVCLFAVAVAVAVMNL